MRAGQIGKLLATVVIVVSTSVRADPWLAVISSGNCSDADLTTQARLVAAKTGERVGEGLLSEEQIEERLGPRPKHSHAELKRQLEAAQSLYYEASFRRAEGMVAAALEDAERLPPTPENFKLLTHARLVHSQVLRSMRRVSEAEAVMSRVLRLDPTYRVDPDLFPPAYQRMFESVRKTVQQAPLVPLSVISTEPGAEVFLDGWKVGKTPFFGRLPRGTYRVMLRRNQMTSLPRVVTLQGDDTRVQVDFAFESGVRASGTPCLADKGDEPTRLSNAVKLGAVLGVSEVVLVRIERQTTGPAWVAASLISVTAGQKIREGGLKLSDSGRAAEGTDELANFIHTGQLGARVVARAVADSAALRSVRLHREKSVEAATKPHPRLVVMQESKAEATPAMAPLVTATPSAPEPRWHEPVGWVSGATGASLIVLGGVFQLQSLGTANEMRAIAKTAEAERGGLSADESIRLVRLDEQASGQQALAVGGFVLGAALGALSGALLVW